MPFRSFRSVSNNFKCFGAGCARAFLLRPFPAASRRIPRARLSPRAKEQAMPALRRPLPAFPSPVKCRRCPPRPPVFRPLRDGRFFTRLFPGRAVFVRSPSDAPAFICAAAHTNAADETDAPRHRRILPFAPLSPDSKGLPPFFERRKSFCLCPLLSLPHKRPPSQSKVLCPKAPRQKHDRRTRGTRRNPV